ncbi:hypothetical protein [Lysobacter tyrosinilyticus]
MRRYFVLPAAVVMLSFASVASAHETIPKNWCVDATRDPKIIVNFQFDGDQLRTLVDKCGIVDVKHDQWTQASLAIGEYCKSVAPAGDDPMPFISGPKSYLTPDHHDGYRLNQGLSGVCAVCPTR